MQFTQEGDCEGDSKQSMGVCGRCRLLKLMPLQSSSADTSTSMASMVQEDMAYVIRHSMKKGYQALSLITPPAYAAISLYRHGRRGFNINKLLRATWIGGGIGVGMGGGAAWLRLRSQSPESVHDRRIRLMYNVCTFQNRKSNEL